MQAFRRTALVAMVLAIAVVVIGGLPGRRIERDDARCWKEEMLFGPRAAVRMVKLYPFQLVIEALSGGKPDDPDPACEAHYVVRERPAAGPELRILSAFLGACALLAVAGFARAATTLILTVGLAGVVIAFVVTRTFDSPFDETTRLWPYYALRACTAALAVAQSALLVIYVQRVMKV